MIGMSMEGRGSVKSESTELSAHRVSQLYGGTPAGSAPGRRGIAARRRIR